MWKESIKVQISYPHKTLIDLLDDPALARGIRFLTDMLQKYFQSERFNPTTLMEYAEKLWQRWNVFQRRFLFF